MGMQGDEIFELGDPQFFIVLSERSGDSESIGRKVFQNLDLNQHSGIFLKKFSEFF